MNTNMRVVTQIVPRRMDPESASDEESDGDILLVEEPIKPKGAQNRLDNAQANACAAITVLQGWAAAGLSVEGDGTAEEALPRRALWGAQSNIARTTADHNAPPMATEDVVATIRQAILPADAFDGRIQIDAHWLLDLLCAQTGRGSVTTRTATTACCGHTSTVENLDQDVAVWAGPPDRAGNWTLEQALEWEAAEAEVQDWKCPTCGARQDARCRTTIVGAPDSMAIKVRRRLDQTSGKDCRHLRLQTPNGSPLLIRSKHCPGGPYEIKAITEHLGNTTDCGHFITYVKAGRCWFKIDDDRVTTVCAWQVAQVQAYILWITRTVEPGRRADSASKKPGARLPDSIHQTDSVNRPRGATAAKRKAPENAAATASDGERQGKSARPAPCGRQVWQSAISAGTNRRRGSDADEHRGASEAGNTIPTEAEARAGLAASKRAHTELATKTTAQAGLATATLRRRATPSPAAGPSARTPSTGAQMEPDGQVEQAPASDCISSYHG